MSHLESLIAEYLDWQGYIVKRNLKVGKLTHGGWQMELDIVAYHPHTQDLVHYEPSLDAHSWELRESRYKKKFHSGQGYILSEVFSWLPPSSKIRQIAVFVSRPQGRETIAGGTIVSIDELVSEIRGKVLECGIMAKNAIPEMYPLLRTMQLTHRGYYKVLTPTA